MPISVYIKFEVFAITNYEDAHNATQNVEIEVV